MRTPQRKSTTLEKKSGRTAIIYLLLLMLAIAAMFSLKRCDSPTSAVTENEEFVDPYYN